MVRVAHYLIQLLSVGEREELCCGQSSVRHPALALARAIAVCGSLCCPCTTMSGTRALVVLVGDTIGAAAMSPRPGDVWKLRLEQLHVAQASELLDSMNQVECLIFAFLQPPKTQDSVWCELADV